MLNYFFPMLSSFDNEKATVVDVLTEGLEWQIAFRGTYWIAHSSDFLSLQPGDFVRVVGREIITLLIEPG
jgi:membrane protein implicated in regulation of membrane protease activity